VSTKKPSAIAEGFYFLVAPTLQNANTFINDLALVAGINGDTIVS
jgi:hypothetical protein